MALARDLFKRDRSAEMLHAVQPDCIKLMPLRDAARLDVGKTATDAVGRHEEGLAPSDQLAAEISEEPDTFG
ncbi:MAG TPA: hypothetical protein PLI43_07800 [Albidovulum sp.]|nr:hypothetical protein [Albidovulum sp.]